MAGLGQHIDQSEFVRTCGGQAVAGQRQLHGDLVRNALRQAQWIAQGFEILRRLGYVRFATVFNLDFIQKIGQNPDGSYSPWLAFTPAQYSQLHEDMRARIHAALEHEYEHGEHLRAVVQETGSAAARNVQLQVQLWPGLAIKSADGKTRSGIDRQSLRPAGGLWRRHPH